MGRTIRAVVLAAFIVFAAVAGLGVFLGFETAGSVVAGLVGGVLAGLLIWAAARRAETFHEVPPVEPGFPGPPEHREDGREGDRQEAAGDQPADGDHPSDEDR